MKKRIGKAASFGVLLAVMTTIAACGDANSSDTRGYTKAPLERASVIITPEGSSAMDSLGTPILPRDTLIPAEAAPAAATTAQ